jgi:hypothetical protein
MRLFFCRPNPQKTIPSFTVQSLNLRLPPRHSEEWTIRIGRLVGDSEKGGRHLRFSLPFVDVGVLTLLASRLPLAQIDHLASVEAR